MSTFRPLLRRTAGLISLALAFALLMGSLCPRGWFVCVQEHGVELAGAGHAVDSATCDEDDCCPDDGCLDFAISLVLDDQAVSASTVVSLPPAMVVAFLPDATRGLTALESPRLVHPGDPPLPDLIRHVRLLV